MPPYRYIPGVGPHPVTHPEGHSFGLGETRSMLSEDGWATHDDYLFGFDLFNNGYFWEAHENWEGVWHATSDADLRILLQNLIQIAAAFLKARTGSDRGVAAFCARISSRLQDLQSRHEQIAGVSLDELSMIILILDRNRTRFGDAEFSATHFPTLLPKTKIFQQDEQDSQDGISKN